jgi:hypothetical protein
MESGHHLKYPQLIIREGRWKLIQVRSPKDQRDMVGGEYELYDVVADPGELCDLSAREPEVVARLEELLITWYRSGPDAITPGEGDVGELEPRELEMLRALGYIQ